VVTACAGCTEGTDHCHGTLVLHGPQLVQCTHGGCVDTQLARHALIVLCAEVDGDCGECTDAAIANRTASGAAA
jgi:hypothetical protein